MGDLVSIIVSVYNVEDYLHSCVKSIVNQTHHNLEIILIDDGSTDKSGLICDELVNKDNRISVIHKKNGGLSDARNFGIKKATGDYLICIDSDDYISCNYVKALLDDMIRTDSDLAVCKMVRTSLLYEQYKDFNEEYNVEVMTKNDALTEMFYGKKINTSACAKLYKSNLFKGIEYPFGKFSEDLFTTYKLIEKANKVVFSSFTGYFYYYRSEGSIVVAEYKEKQLEAIEALNQIKNDINLVDGKIEKAYASQVLSVLGDLLVRNPSRMQIKNSDIWILMKQYRSIVLHDENAMKRLRAIALLSYLGPDMTVKLLLLYYRNKWSS